MENEIEEPQAAYGLKKNITPAEYLEMDANSERKVEYLYGEVLVNQGESLNHNRIVSCLIGEIGNQLENTESIVFASQMRVVSAKFYSFTYPDICIVQNNVELNEGIFDTLTNPVIIIEVVSKTSVINDYRKKFLYYKQIQSLLEYVLIDSFNNICVDVFRRQSDNQWLNETYQSLEENLVLQSVGVMLSLKDIYENITFETKEEI